jgi:uncharacterized protein (DUF924 family)
MKKPTSDTASLPPEARDVLDFWFGDPTSSTYGSSRVEWFRKDPAFDASIRDRFGALIERGLRGELEAWAATPLGALAQVIVLDQFTRNVFRETPRAFAGDARALNAARAMVGSRQDEELPPFQRAFVYLPFEHAEGIDMQHEAVRLYTRLVALDPAQAGGLDYAERHRDIIERFGRFPHRNDILGRQSTAEEIEFLKTPGSGF